MAASDGTGAQGEPTFEQKRHDELTSAPNSSEEDAAPRIDVTVTEDGTTRIDWRDDAVVRPGDTD
jgi:hypothetical protein